jgi:hypothetical protein
MALGRGAARLAPGCRLAEQSRIESEKAPYRQSKAQQEQESKSEEGPGRGASGSKMQLLALAVFGAVAAAQHAQGAGLRSGNAPASVNTTFKFGAAVAAQNATSERGMQAAGKVPNLDKVLMGQDILKFHLVDTGGQRAAVFRGAYAQGQETVDGRFKVPDGYDMTATTMCSGDVSVNEIRGEKSLVESQTTEVELSAAYGNGLIAGSFKNNMAFKKHRDEMSKTSSTLQEAKLKCSLYQVSIQNSNLPPFSVNFANAVQRLASQPGKLTASSASSIVAEFGTHYIVRASMGGSYTRLTKTTRQERAKLESSGISIQAAATASFWGVEVGARVLNEKQKSQSEYFSSFASDFSTSSMGTKLPAGGATIDEITQNWQRDLMTSTGLAMIGGFKFERIDALLDSDRGAAKRILDAQDLGSATLITAARLSEVRAALAGAIDGACEMAKLECSKPADDSPVPQAPTMRVVKWLNKAVGNKDGGKPFAAYYDSEMAARFSRDRMTYDLRPHKIVTWWGTYGGAKVLTGLQLHYIDSKGSLSLSEKFGKGKDEECEIVIPATVRVKNLEIYSGTAIDYIRVKVGNDWKGCGNRAGGHTTTQVNLINDDYFLGFEGSSADIVDSLNPLRATTAK